MGPCATANIAPDDTQCKPGTGPPTVPNDGFQWTKDGQPVAAGTAYNRYETGCTHLYEPDIGDHKLVSAMCYYEDAKYASYVCKNEAGACDSQAEWYPWWKRKYFNLTGNGQCIDPMGAPWPGPDDMCQHLGCTPP